MSDGHAPDRVTDDARPGMLSVRHVTKAFSGTGSRTAGDAADDEVTLLGGHGEGSFPVGAVAVSGR